MIYRRCRNCGAPAPATGTTCLQCGSSLLMPAIQPATASSGSSLATSILGALVLIGGLGVVGVLAWNAMSGSSEPEPRLVGEIGEWDAVDDARGYVHFTVTNEGEVAATATCTVSVRNDFGNFGVDVMTGER